MRLLAYLSDRRYLSILLLGFSSGLPLLLVGSTLRFWLADAKIDIRTIGLFALVSLPYALKFLWSPVFDNTRLPLGRLGRRRGWGLVIQLCLIVALLLLSTAHPEDDATRIAEMAVVVAFLSASQDIVIDALRIDMLQPAEYAIGGAITALGYRIGMLAAGAGALYLAQFGDWHVAYRVMAGLVAIGITGMAIAPEPEITLPRGTWREWLERSIVQPFADFMTRPRWPVIVAFILTYKLATVLGLSLTSPFYKSLGFDKAEVANVTKVFGLAATIAGGFAGAWLVGRAGVWRSLLWCGIAQALALYPFWYLSLAGHSLPVLIAAIGAENVTGAMAATAFGTYIAALCDRRFTATQFALLTSLAALTGETLASTTGYMVVAVGWPEFFLLIPLAALPGLALLFMLRETLRNRDQKEELSST